MWFLDISVFVVEWKAEGRQPWCCWNTEHTLQCMERERVIHHFFILITKMRDSTWLLSKRTLNFAPISIH